jgi:hypothetical protein
MKGQESVDRLIGQLTDELVPVRRLWAPWARAALWIGLLAAIAAYFSMTSDVSAMLYRLGTAADMWLSVVGSTFTAILAAIAVFQLSLPDRSPRWALLPLPGVVLWVGASGFGCLRVLVEPASGHIAIADPNDCFIFIVGMSIPLSAVMIFMLRRAFTLRPNLTAVIGGLAVASAAATLLNFVHPFNVTISDLAVHVLAITIVVSANRLLGGSLLNPSK